MSFRSGSHGTGRIAIPKIRDSHIVNDVLKPLLQQCVWRLGKTAPFMRQRASGAGPAGLVHRWTQMPGITLQKRVDSGV